MKRECKIVIIFACTGIFIFLGLLDLRINTDGLLCRALFPTDTFLIIEGEEDINVWLNVVLDGKRRKVKAFIPEPE